MSATLRIQATLCRDDQPVAFLSRPLILAYDRRGRPTKKSLRKGVAALEKAIRHQVRREFKLRPATPVSAPAAVAEEAR